VDFFGGGRCDQRRDLHLLLLAHRGRHGNPGSRRRRYAGAIDTTYVDLSGRRRDDSAGRCLGLAVPRLGFGRRSAAALAGWRKTIEQKQQEINDDESDNKGSLSAITRQFTHYAITGIMFPVSTALGFFGGYFLDQWLGTIPLFSLIGLGLGVAAAIRNLLRTVAADDDT